MTESENSFVHYLDEWSTETLPDVLVNYVFLPGDKTVGEQDSFEISVIRAKKDIWSLLTDAEQLEVEHYCKLHHQQSINEWNQP